MEKFLQDRNRIAIMGEYDPCPQCEEGRDATFRCGQCDDRCCEECSRTYERVVTYIDDSGEEVSGLEMKEICGFCDPQYAADRQMENEEVINVVWDWV